MTTYTHHISGRLRTRYPQLKSNPTRARAAEAAIRNIHGVISVEASTITGSLLIRYDAHAPQREALLDTLYRTKQQLGLIQAPQPSAPVPTVPKSVAATLADKVLGMTVEKCIERSTFALLAALL
ncbi:MAG TPA: hypothetical protein VM571_02745 [Noviherbaspirillum sp.]|nr:hypothetical protein [Noviherbaspirillum sp.]